MIFPSNSTLVYFDVISLFLKTSNQVTLDHSQNLLSESHVPPEKVSDSMKLLKFCWSSNTCLFGEEFYTFPEDIGILLKCLII